MPLTSSHVWGMCPHLQTASVCGTALMVEVKSVKGRLGSWGHGGLLEVVQSCAQPYTVVSCEAYSVTACSALLLCLFPERHSSCVHAHQLQAAGFFPREEVGLIGSTENLADFQWQGKSEKLCAAGEYRLKREEHLAGRNIFLCWGVFKKSLSINSPVSEFLMMELVQFFLSYITDRALLSSSAAQVPMVVTNEFCSNRK